MRKIVTAALLLAAVIAAMATAEWRARGRAQAFCERFAVGGEMAAVRAAASAEGDRLLRSLQPDRISVGYTGLPPFSRHLCVIESREGRIVAVRRVRLD